MAEQIIIEYKVEVDALKAELKQVQAQLKGIENKGKEAATTTTKEFNKAGTDIKAALGSIAGAIGLAFGTAQIIAFGKESIKAFSEAEVNANKLKFAVTQIGKEGKLAFDKLIEQSGKLQDISIFSDDDIQKAQTQLATLGLNSKQIEELIPKVLDLASATGQELGAATDNIIQGINGQTRGLRAVGLEFEATGDKTKNLAILTENLNKFQGATATALETTAGKTKRLENAFGDLQEKIGELLVDEGNKLLDFIDVLSGKTSVAESGIKTLSKAFVDAYSKDNDEILKRAGENAQSRLAAEKIVFDKITALKKAFDKSNNLAEKKSFADAVQNQVALLAEIRKTAVEGAGLKSEIDKEAAAKALEQEKKLQLELRDLKASLIEDEKSRELAQLINKYTDLQAATKEGDEKRLILQELYLKERDALIKKYNDKEKADNDALFEEAIKTAEAASDAQAKIDLANYNEGKKLRDKEVEDEKKKQADIVAVKQASFDSSVELVNSLNQIYQNQLTTQLDSINQVYNAEVQSLDAQLRNKEISQRQYDLKKAELDRKQRDEAAKINKKAFEAQKNLALINAAISTATAILKAQEAASPPYNYALMAIAAANGAAQIAVINSQPTPKFAKGGKVGGRLHSEGGTLIEAEKDEWIIKRNESLKNNDLLNAINKGKGQKYIYEMYVAPALKEQLKKHNTSKDNDFASSIASSMMLNSGQFKDGNILESLKMLRKSDKENVEKLITVISKQQINPRSIV